RAEQFRRTDAGWEAGERSVPLVEGDLDGAGAVLRGEHGERVTPRLVEREGVGEHPAEVDAAGFDQVEVVVDAVLAHAVDLLDAERVRAHPAQLLEVERR